LKINLFSPWYSWKITELALNNNHSLTHLKQIAFELNKCWFLYNLPITVWNTDIWNNPIRCASYILIIFIGLQLDNVMLHSVHPQSKGLCSGISVTSRITLVIGNVWPKWSAIYSCNFCQLKIKFIHISINLDTEKNRKISSRSSLTCLILMCEQGIYWNKDS